MHGLLITLFQYMGVLCVCIGVSQIFVQKNLLGHEQRKEKSVAVKGSIFVSKLISTFVLLLMRSVQILSRLLSFQKSELWLIEHSRVFCIHYRALANLRVTNAAVTAEAVDAVPVVVVDTVYL